MKKLVIACSMLVSSFALADSPRIEPGPVVKMGDEAKAIAHVLLNRQVSKCVDEFQKHEVSISSVTMRNIAPGHVVYKVKGAVLVGGDVATGRIALHIEEKEARGFGFNRVKVYSCHVSKT
jgi:hypothetical protein